MSLRPFGPAVVVLSIIASAGCRKPAHPLDRVQQMAYGVKPAVVRVSALSTAKFRYDAKSLGEVEAVLAAGGHPLLRNGVDDFVAETGAGGSGSGFAVHPDGYILTSAHVITPTSDSAAIDPQLRRNGAIAALLRHFPPDAMRDLFTNGELEPAIEKLARSGKLEQLTTSNQVELSNGEIHPYTLVRSSAPEPRTGDDLALLHIRRAKLPTLRLGDSDAVHLQEPVWAVGYPAVASSGDDVIGGWLSSDSDLEATFNPGTITAIKKNIAAKPLFQSNVAIYSGNSGGPAVNRDGEVIGIAMWGHTSAEQVKFLLPINSAKPFLAAAEVPLNVEGPFNASYRRALREAAAGNWEAAKRELANAGKIFPNSPDLIRFQRDAEAALAGSSFWRDASAALPAGAIGVASVAALLGLTSLRRRRRRRILIPPVVAEVVVTPERRESAANGGTKGVTAPEGSLLGKLTVLNGEHAGERYGLGGSGIRIGRESGVCEIVLDNPRVSRLHAEVVTLDGRVLLIDRNSSNGTYVNDQKVERRFLSDGDIIYFGGRNAIAVAFHIVSA